MNAFQYSSIIIWGISLSSQKCPFAKISIRRNPNLWMQTWGCRTDEPSCLKSIQEVDEAENDHISLFAPILLVCTCFPSIIINSVPFDSRKFLVEGLSKMGTWHINNKMTAASGHWDWKNQCHYFTGLFSTEGFQRSQEPVSKVLCMLP